MYTHRPYPVARIELRPRELELIVNSLDESMHDREEFDERQQAAELAVLIRKLDKASNALITH